MAFINKMDRLGADIDGTVQQIRERLGSNPLPIQIPLGQERDFQGVVDLTSMRALRWQGSTGEPPQSEPIPPDLEQAALAAREQLLEGLAECDDEFAVLYLEGAEISAEEARATLRRVTVSSQAVPVLMGSALRNCGVEPLLDAITQFLPSPLDVPPVSGMNPRSDGREQREPSEQAPFAALAFKIVADPHAGKLAYFRVYSGKVEPGASILNATRAKTERLTRVLRMHADKREEVQSSIQVGDILAAVGLRSASTGDTFTDPRHPILLESIAFPEPVVTIAIEPRSRADQDRIIAALQRLGEEDPTFRVSSNEETGQTLVAGMGELHLEVIVDRLLREYRVAANIGRPQVSYRERPRRSASGRGRFIRQTGGRGQYGDVSVSWSRWKPATAWRRPQGSEVAPSQPAFSPAVEQGLRRALTSGPNGYQVTDVRVTAVDGAYHEVDSSELAFEMAAAMAVRDAIDKARTYVVEPVMAVQIVVPEEYVGDVLGGLGAKRGTINAVEIRGGAHVIDVEVPLATMFGYANELRSATQGRGQFTMEFARYAASAKAGLC